MALSSLIAPVIHPCWSPLPMGVLKLNFDGSASGNPGPAGLGGLMCDHEGCTICSYSGPAGHSTVNKAEKLALVVGF